MGERIELDRELIVLADRLLSGNPILALCRQHGMDPVQVKKSFIVLLYELQKAGWVASPNAAPVLAPAPPKGQLPLQKLPAAKAVATIARPAPRTMNPPASQAKPAPPPPVAVSASPASSRTTNPTQLKEVFLRFKALDQKKYRASLDNDEEKSWYLCHNILMTKLFNEPYSALLDKRRFIRVPLALPIELRLLTSKVPLVTKNISLGGMLMPHFHKLSQGDKVKFGLTLGGTPIRVSAKMTWTSEKHRTMACSFLDMTTTELDLLSQAIYAYIEERIAAALATAS